MKLWCVEFWGYTSYVEAESAPKAKYLAWKDWQSDPCICDMPFKHFLEARVCEWKYGYLPGYVNKWIRAEEKLRVTA